MTLYWKYVAGSDNDWNNVLNWFTDAAATVQADYVPWITNHYTGYDLALATGVIGSPTIMLNSGESIGDGFAITGSCGFDIKQRGTIYAGTYVGFVYVDFSGVIQGGSYYRVDVYNCGVFNNGTVGFGGFGAIYVWDGGDGGGIVTGGTFNGSFYVGGATNTVSGGLLAGSVNLTNAVVTGVVCTGTISGTGSIDGDVSEATITPSDLLYVNGYNGSGFDVNGHPATWPLGYDVNGYDVNGYDVNGFDVNGYNQYGYNSLGFNESGEFSQDLQNPYTGWDAGTSAYYLGGYLCHGLDQNGNGWNTDTSSYWFVGWDSGATYYWNYSTQTYQVYGSDSELNYYWNWSTYLVGGSDSGLIYCWDGDSYQVSGSDSGLNYYFDGYYFYLRGVQTVLDANGTGYDSGIYYEAGVETAWSSLTKSGEDVTATIDGTSITLTYGAFSFTKTVPELAGGSSDILGAGLL